MCNNIIYINLLDTGKLWNPYLPKKGYSAEQAGTIEI